MSTYLSLPVKARRCMDNLYLPVKISRVTIGISFNGITKNSIHSFLRTVVWHSSNQLKSGIIYYDGVLFCLSGKYL